MHLQGHFSNGQTKTSRFEFFQLIFKPVWVNFERECSPHEGDQCNHGIKEKESFRRRIGGVKEFAQILEAVRT